MQRGLCLLALFALAAAAGAAQCVHLWPQPRSVSVAGSGSKPIDTQNFELKLNSGVRSNEIINSVLSRYQKLILQKFPVSSEISFPPSKENPPVVGNALTELVIQITDTNAYSTAIDLGVDESYKLDISEDRHSAHLTAQTWVGMLRGLETFSQLIVSVGPSPGSADDAKLVVACVPIIIEDAPRFPWRGFLLDTARHFHPLWSIRRVIDAMSYNKLNVLHWHIVDAEAFPLQLKSRPELAAKGAYGPTQVYSASDVQEVIKYAFERGIRVVPELDTPGHTYSWGAAYPEMILKCEKFISSRTTFPGINNVPLDMTKNITYEILKDVYEEATSLFSDQYMHVGGDEVSFTCLDEFPWVKQWIRDNINNSSSASYKDLLRYFRQKLTPIITNKKKMVVWQEAFDEMRKLESNPLSPSNTIVQVWINDNYTDQIRDSVSSGYPTLMSSGWYLDQQVPAPDKSTRYLFLDTWRDFYAMEPMAQLDGVPNADKLVLGGEVCQWGENINPYNIDGSVWTRAAASAERLWSPREVNDPNQAYHRLVRFQCHMLQRGIAATPVRPNVCVSPVLDALYNAQPATAAPVEPDQIPPALQGPARIQFSLAAFLMGVVAAIIIGLVAGGASGFWLGRRTSTVRQTTSDGYSALDTSVN